MTMCSKIAETKLKNDDKCENEVQSRRLVIIEYPLLSIRHDHDNNQASLFFFVCSSHVDVDAAKK